MQPSTATVLAPAVAGCDASTSETPLKAQQGSAGIMYNLAEHPESIRVIAKQLLKDAVATATKPVATASTAAATVGAAPTVVFRVAPRVYLPTAQQQTLCVKLSDQTTKRPLMFGAHKFATVDKLDAWIMQFSQGHGTDGELLYRQCAGNCDPSFTFVITPVSAGLSVSTEVYCGFARDRKDDMYNLSTALRPRCQAAAR